MMSKYMKPFPTYRVNESQSNEQFPFRNKLLDAHIFHKMINYIITEPSQNPFYRVSSTIKMAVKFLYFAIDSSNLSTEV